MMDRRQNDSFNLTICPDGTPALTTGHSWPVYWTLFNSTELFCRYASMLDKYQRFAQTQHLAKNVLCWVFGAAGVLGAILTWLTLHGKDRRFAAVSFVYFRVGAVLEFLNGVLMISHGSLFYLHRQRGHVRTYANYFYLLPVINTIGTIIVLLTVFMSVERALACFTVRAFARINRRWVAYWVCIFCSVFTGVIYIPLYFAQSIAYNNRTETFTVDRSAFARSDIYRKYEETNQACNYILAVVVLLTTALSVVGLIRVVMLKLSLERRTHGHTWGQLRRKKSPVLATNLQLCTLQLCQAVPAAIECLMTAVQMMMSRNVTVGFEQVAAAKLDFPTAVKHLSVSGWLLTTAVVINFFYELRHCMNFYLYVCLSPSFRKAFFDKVARLRDVPKSPLSSEVIENVVKPAELPVFVISAAANYHPSKSPGLLEKELVE